MFNLTSKHKALIFTTLIAAIVVLMVLNLHLSRSLDALAETYYELEPQPETKKELEEVKETKSSFNNKKTNLAFNENQKFNDLDDDYMDKVKAHYDKYAKASKAEQSTDKIKDDYTLEKVSAYDEINNLLSTKNKNKKSVKSNGNNSSDKISIGKSNSNSTMSYSLVGRNHEFLPTPIYLCEDSGIIIINITVNDKGYVTNTSVNGASTSSNQCLIDHAMEYAKNARFSINASKKTQIGTITFRFVGKN